MYVLSMAFSETTDLNASRAEFLILIENALSLAEDASLASSEFTKLALRLENQGHAVLAAEILNILNARFRSL